MRLVAAAPAATAPSAATRLRGEGFGPAARRGRTEHRKLDSSLLAGALGAGDFLLFVNYDLLKLVFAIVADVFVYGHFARSRILRS